VATGALAAEFIIPANAGINELSAMLQAASAVGTSYPYRDDLDIAVSQTENADQANKLYVGLNVTGGLPLPVLGAGQGALAVGRENGVNRLVVTGADALGLERAVRVLSTASLLKEAQDQTIASGATMTTNACAIAISIGTAVFIAFLITTNCAHVLAPSQAAIPPATKLVNPSM
ncbi:MAG: hypothetical protein EOM13_10415, partial [Clostridia bacterium]|nr:hypothetical protein [Clostridia bacterium]